MNAKDAGGRCPGIYVINLARRTDRYQQMCDHLFHLGLEHARVEAVDVHMVATTSPAHQLLLPTEEAIFRSHKRAWSMAGANLDHFSLILEDDARLRIDVDWQRLLPELALQCQIHNLDILQLGHLEYGWKGRLLYSAHEAAYALPERRLRPRTVDFSFHEQVFKARVGVFRGGSHAYLLSAGAAHKLGRLQPPFAFPIDVFFGHLANPLTKRGTMTFASLKDAGLASQLGQTFGQTADSDNFLR